MSGDIFGCTLGGLLMHLVGEIGCHCVATMKAGKKKSTKTVVTC